MKKYFIRAIALLGVFIIFFPIFLMSKTIVFYEKNFPAVDNGSINRNVLEDALSALHPQFIDLAELLKKNSLDDCTLLVLPYGSAFPADAWATLQAYVTHGNLLVLGGTPFFVPVRKINSEWQIERSQNTFSRHLGILHTYAVPQHGPWKLQWDEDAPFFHGIALNPRQVFVNAGHGERYRGLGFMTDSLGNRLAAPIVAEDLIDANTPRRYVYLSFDAAANFWTSHDGTDLIRQTAMYASHGGIRLWINLQNLTIDSGDHVSGVVDIIRAGELARVTLNILSDTTVLSTKTMYCGNSLHEKINLNQPLTNRTLYKVRATLNIGDTILEQYTSGFAVRDTGLLHSGESLSAGRDYFRLGDNPYFMVGTNYFSTDAYTSGLFVGNALGGNVWKWEQDFAEMERQGLTAVRTGIWMNRKNYLDPVTGAPDERMLNALEAYLCAAARHHMQVIFTFFAFNPQNELEAGNGQEGTLLGAGSNPYLDPVAIKSQLAYVRAIVSRFRNVPFLSFDLINEPSYANPRRIWKGNSPNNDPVELAAWHQWLAKKYGAIERLADAWRTAPAELGAFNNIPLPSLGDRELIRSGNFRMAQAIDYNIFAQDAFQSWVDTMITAIRAAGAQQAVTVGQDEGGIADRVLNQFWAKSHVSYTVNHSWWRDDALLWSSVAAKSLLKPNLIGETGSQPVWSMDGSWRWDEIQGMPMLERKLALGFAGANAGVLQWDWTRSDTYGMLRRDGSQKEWMNTLRGVASFAHDAQPYATGVQLPEIALVLPQSLQLSVFCSMGIFAQQNAVRALYHYARAEAFAVGEYQLAQMPKAKLIIVPAPWIFNQDAWNMLMQKVKAGATLLISGRIDADEHWIAIPERIKDLKLEYASAALTAREGEIQTPEGKFHFTYSGDRTTYGERGALKDGKTFIECSYGKGQILYSPLPLEFADQIDEVGQIYRYAMKRAGVATAYETTCHDPGILICPTQLLDGTLYVLTSESSDQTSVTFRDNLSNETWNVPLASGRAALLLIGKDGRRRASYNAP
ncbi:MAG TPA: beta-galactosidase [Bacteroidota bacterium]|nr:beta-galactosidase [Bacteroidota bacterium]